MQVSAASTLERLAYVREQRVIMGADWKDTEMAEAAYEHISALWVARDMRPTL